MKKLICVMALVCIGILLVSCGLNRPGDPKAQFIRDFGLHIDKKDCVLEELFNNYEGFPYPLIGITEKFSFALCSAVGLSTLDPLCDRTKAVPGTALLCVKGSLCPFRLLF